MTSTHTIYAPWNSGLGDAWASISLLACKSYSLETPILMHSEKKFRTRHEEILDSMDLIDVPSWRDDANLKLVDDPATTSLEGFDVWATSYWPTARQWSDSIDDLRTNMCYQRSGHSYVCYQFDGESAASDKNPSPEDERTLIDVLERSGFKAVRLGKHLSIAQCVRAAANSAFFVGVDSGMSHLCHSVGVPMFLIEYKLPIVTCHRGKSYIHCQGTDDFLRWKLPTWIDYLRFIGHPDGQRSTVPRGRKVREAMGAWWTRV